MSNERLTENIVRDHFKNDPLYSSIKMEEQKSTNIRISECLMSASKSGKGVGRPEFIISFPTQNMDYLLVIECKANIENHKSLNLDIPKQFAVDGVLHYARFLAEEFNVIAIAVSGEQIGNLYITQYLYSKKAKNPILLTDKELLHIFEYVKIFKNEQLSYNLKNINIVQKSVQLNERFHKCSISESTRCTLVSAILLALQDNAFKVAYPVSKTSNELAEHMLSAIERVLKEAHVQKIDNMMGVYRNILNEPLVKEKTIKKNRKSVETIEEFQSIVSYLEKQVYPLMTYEDSGYDILGRFYTEFIRYAASKQKQGLVLTPSHVTELFCDLAQLKVDDIVYDPCCGTGGFLIAAMKYMINLAGNNVKRRESIRENQLLGVELRPEMFTFACSNMMLRGDGKSNIDCGDCFNNDTADKIKKHKPTVAFLNPPYDQGPAAQLQFIERAIEAVSSQNGHVVAIVQMSCAIKDEAEAREVRKRLLENNTLKAVISMPDDLFYPVGVVTCIMVFDANSPNKGKKTWFGYLKEDGFTKRKNKGRVDYHSKWQSIKANFIDAYINNDTIAGLSVRKEVTENDEWCAEAYMDTDYSKITQDDFENVLKKYSIFRTIGITESLEDIEDEEDEND